MISNHKLASWPGSSRPSTSLVLHGFEDVDARDKRGHDGDQVMLPV
jgi:hypothetical protein